MTHTRPQLLLIGLRCSGKSTVARMLAATCEVRAIDLDDITPRMLGLERVAEVFEQFNEAAFRDAEFRALQSPACCGASIVALGGGTPTAAGAPELLRAAAASGSQLIYLRARAGTLASRLLAADNAHRPSLSGDDPAVEITAQFESRDALYRQLASRVIETDELTFEEIVEQLNPQLATLGFLSAPGGHGS